ncbi:uncharacterized protein LOC109718707 isoform X2 [Ananas comosus]|uniref:Uncharacterized protein LOC109718707 isoform X2 n=1 Tax=Ananas comosus TaxID=4615 RepID=A0A6P5G4K0_ANACO|nr:uncharacterized protein LOC109718707 isoform X2 [Ananas comosus]
MASRAPLLSPTPSTLTFSPSIRRIRPTNLPFSPTSSPNPSPNPKPYQSRFNLRPIRFRNPLPRSSAAPHGRDPIPVAAEEAREALVDLLREFGASEEDSIRISSNSPKYIDMLLASVRELDDHGLWGSWSSGIDEGGEKGDLSSFDLKSKVYYMAKSKGDKGMLPFLESVGLKLSSAMLIARYLSLQSLPEIIDKVMFVKEMLFSSSGSEVLTGRNAKRMMLHFSIHADEDIQSTLSFFEKMEARHGGLNMLGHENASFPYLIESFPRLLSRSKEKHLEPLVYFLEDSGIPKSEISAILLTFPPILLYDIERDLKPRMHALEKAGVEEKDIASMLMKYPWILSTSIQENYSEILAYFKGEKVLNSIVEKAVRSWPHILGCSTQKMKSIMEQFSGLGVTKKMLVPVITSSPQLLLRKPDEFLQVVSLLEEMGFDHRKIGRILCRCPEIFAASVDNTLKKKIEFLIKFGISSNHLPRIIRKYPELLLLDINNTLLPRAQNSTMRSFQMNI